MKKNNQLHLSSPLQIILANIACNVSYKTNKIIDRVNLYYHNHQSRLALKNLNDNQLLDLGITKEKATQEANKRFWN